MTAIPAALTWSGVIARRMDRHALAEPATDLDPADVAARLCGVHAQVLSAAEFSIGRSARAAPSTCCPPPTARQRRELDDEAAIVGAVNQAAPTLTVGQVTVGPHA